MEDTSENRVDVQFVQTVSAQIPWSHNVVILDKVKDEEQRIWYIVNNGFYEGRQNHIAIEQMKLWCKAVNLTWGQASGTGAGEMYPLVKDIPLGHGPNKNIGHALKDLAHHVLAGRSGTEHLISVNWPRFLWRIQASMLVWYPRAKADGLKKQDMFKQMKP